MDRKEEDLKRYLNEEDAKREDMKEDSMEEEGMK
jgi:hypothetical protein